MHNRLKVVVAVMVALLALTCSVNAQGFRCILLAPAHDWTWDVGRYRFGLRGWGSTTEVWFGPDGFDVPFPFYGVVAGTGVLAVAIGSLGFSLTRRNKADRAG
jgi:hypothetical protein